MEKSATNFFHLDYRQATLSQMAWLGAGLVVPIAVYVYSAPLLAIIQSPLMIISYVLLAIVVGCPWTTNRIEKAIDYSLVKKEFIKDKRISDHVQRVGGKIAIAAGQRANSIRFCVLDESQYIQAFAANANYVVITVGMYRDFRNEDELASVLAHEVGHIVMNKRRGWVRKSLEECREEEYQADQLAVEFATKAGYQPSAYGQLHWRTMGYAHRSGHNIFRDDASSTHPSKLKRIIAVNRFIELLT